jgi:DNA-binding transcriptional regulator YiaG
MSQQLAAVIKEEVQRLARKEVKAQLSTLKSSSAQHRRDIAELKRRVRDLTRQVAFLKGQEKKRVGKPAPEKLAEGARFSAAGVKSHRAKLGLSAADYGQLVGVSGLTIYNWEHGKSRPRQKQLASLVEVKKLGKREAWKRLELMEG